MHGEVYAVTTYWLVELPGFKDLKCSVCCLVILVDISEIFRFENILGQRLQYVNVVRNG